jgi:hypothetical protein
LPTRTRTTPTPKPPSTRTPGNVVDTEAAGYVDPTLVITEEDNKRLRMMVHKRYVALPIRGSRSDGQGPAVDVPGVLDAGDGQR